MSATASCKFPFLDEWKKLSSKNIILSFFDEVLSGFAQLAFNDNSFSGLLIIIGIFIASPVQAISAVWATIVATATAHILGVSKGLIRAGLYGFNAALAGLAIPTLIFPGSSLTLAILLYTGLAAIFTVVMTAGLGSFFSKWEVPALALPYCVTMLIFVPAALSLGNLNIRGGGLAIFEVIRPGAQGSWTIFEFIRASLNGVSQILWVDYSITGIFYLLAVLMASRIDLISVVFGALVSTTTAIALGLPKELIMEGIYGFNGVLLMMVITRGFLISVKSYILAIVLAILTVVYSAGLRVLLAPLGAVASFAIPYATLCIAVFIGRDMFKDYIYVPASRWGVPETILKKYKDKLKA